MANGDNIETRWQKRLDVLRGEFAGKRLLLTGGTGFFGKHLQQSFVAINAGLKNKAELVVLSRNPKRFLEYNASFQDLPGISYIKGDIRDFEFPACEFDYVMHAATEASLKLEQENPDEMYSVIVDGTKRVLEFVKSKQPERLLYVSSGAVYGPQPVNISNITEEYPCAPVTSYGKGKLLAENMCVEAAGKYGFVSTIARAFAFIGPYLPLNAHFAAGNFLNSCLRKEPIVIKGDGTPLRSYMHPMDMVVWLWNIMLYGKTTSCYNVGSDSQVSILELAKLMASYLDHETRITICSRVTSGQKPSRYVPSIEKAKSELGLDVDIELPEALKSTIQWHLAHGHR